MRQLGDARYGRRPACTAHLPKNGVDRDPVFPLTSTARRWPPLGTLVSERLALHL